MPVYLETMRDIIRRQHLQPKPNTVSELKVALDQAWNSERTKLIEIYRIVGRHAWLPAVTEWIDVVLWGCLMGFEGIRLARNRRARSRQVYVDPTTSDTVNIGNITPSA
ncbi:hypothetical protein TNCV_107801 [Trichonephila clavipes]|nr:hypothetical protein TNCV_107801 [Trichonephila clavipes]